MQNSSGFTLIELLVVVAIIGILAAIAVPQFADYRTRAFNSRALSDTRNLMAAEEAYFVDYERYTDDIDALSGFDAASDGVVVQLFNSFGDDGIYGVMSYHANGSETYCYISDDDSAIRAETGAPAPMDDCIF